MAKNNLLTSKDFTVLFFFQARSDEKIVIFCDGDFWHGYNYHKKKKPSKKYWKEKIERNIKRDQKYTRKLRREGWSVLRLWEHDIEKRTGVCIDKIIRKILEK